MINLIESILTGGEGGDAAEPPAGHAGAAVLRAAVRRGAAGSQFNSIKKGT